MENIIDLKRHGVQYRRAYSVPFERITIHNIIVDILPTTRRTRYEFRLHENPFIPGTYFIIFLSLTHFFLLYNTILLPFTYNTLFTHMGLQNAVHYTVIEERTDSKHERNTLLL